MRDHLVDAVTALVNLVTVALVTWNRQHLRTISRRLDDAERLRRVERVRRWTH